jgi:hypothetical protein
MELLFRLLHGSERSGRKYGCDVIRGNCIVRSPEPWDDKALLVARWSCAEMVMEASSGIAITVPVLRVGSHFERAGPYGDGHPPSSNMRSLLQVRLCLPRSGRSVTIFA